jgi:hypothetical protein
MTVTITGVVLELVKGFCIDSGMFSMGVSKKSQSFVTEEWERGCQTLDGWYLSWRKCPKETKDDDCGSLALKERSS